MVDVERFRSLETSFSGLSTSSKLVQGNMQVFLKFSHA